MNLAELEAEIRQGDCWGPRITTDPESLDDRERHASCLELERQGKLVILERRGQKVVWVPPESLTPEDRMTNAEMKAQVERDLYEGDDSQCYPSEILRDEGNVAPGWFH